MGKAEIAFQPRRLDRRTHRGRRPPPASLPVLNGRFLRVIITQDMDAMRPQSSYITRRLTVRFLTPAFLGDAEQKGRWRTPPFKALLRQWWRVAYAAAKNFNVNVLDMREIEGRLFGNAWLTRRENGREKLAAERSKVRLRLSGWDQGTLPNWTGLEAQGMPHPEVQRQSIGPHLYLGYGPLAFAQGGTALQRVPAIKAGESADLYIAVPKGEASPIEQALYLMHLYGAAGGRSRNGWGSFVLEWANGDWPPDFKLPIRSWQQALAFDWPHAIGADGQGPLIWQTTEPSTDWKHVMRTLALIRMAVRTQFLFSAPEPHQAPEERHWLAYPVTNHECRPWGKNLRLPNTLRCKVRPSEKKPDELVGVVFHVPCLPPPEFAPQRAQIEQVWVKVHALLDELCKPAQQRRYPQGLVSYAAWKTQIQPELDKVQLQRAPR